MAKGLVSGLSGKYLSQDTWDNFFFLIAEMNFQDKNSNSVVNIFAIMAGVYLLAYLSTCLFTKYVLSVYYE